MEKDELSLSNLVGALWRRKWIIILVVVVAGGSAWAFTPRPQLMYEATATLIVQSRAEPTSLLDAVAGTMGSQDIASQLEVMRSRSVLEQAVKALEPDRAEDPEYLQTQVEALQRSLKIQQVKGTSLVSLSVASVNPVKAQQQADAIAEAYIYEANRAQLSASQAALENVNQQLQELRQANVDLSLSPSLPRAVAQMDTAITAIEKASGKLALMPEQPASDLPSEPPVDITAITTPQLSMVSGQVDGAKADVEGLLALVQELDQRVAEAAASAEPEAVVQDPGTTLTGPQLSILVQQVTGVKDRSDELAALLQRMDLSLALGVALQNMDLASIETRAQAMSTTLGPVAAEGERLRQAETDPQARGQLLAAESRLKVAQVAAAAVSSQAQSLYDRGNATLVHRMSEYMDMVVESLDVSLQELDGIEPRKAASPQGQPAPAGSLAPQDFDIAPIETRAQYVAARLAPIATEVERMRLAETELQVRGQLLNAETRLKVAQGAAAALSAQVQSFYDRASVTLAHRMVEYAAQVRTSLEGASDQLVQVQPVKAPDGARPAAGTILTQSQLVAFSDRVQTIAASLRDLAGRFESPGSDPAREGIVLDYAELAAMEASFQTAGTTVATLRSEAGKMQQAQVDAQARDLLIAVDEQIRIAGDAITRMPALMQSLSESAIESPRFVALDGLRQKLEVSLLGVDSQVTRVGDKALISPPAVDPLGRYKNGIFGAVAGLLLAAFGTLVAARFDRRVRHDPRTTSYAGLPLLASIPKAPVPANPGRPSVAARDCPAFLEAFRLLRTRLELDTPEHKIVLVTSPGASEGKTTVAANLARVVAAQGYRVLLVDGNLRKPDIARTLGASVEGPALSGPEESVLPCPTRKADGIDIFACGPVQADSDETLSSSRMRAFLREAKQNYDVIIVDSSPVMGFADTQILARQADMALLVLEVNASNIDLAEDSKQALDTAGIRIAGCVLNKVERKGRRLPGQGRRGLLP